MGPKALQTVENPDPQAVFLAQVKRYIDERLAPPPGGSRDLTLEDIRLRFKSHPPKTPQIAGIHVDVRTNFIEFATAMNGLPSGREKALMYTALEEASFWAHAAIARQKENQS